ncbi:hypothetical protein BDA96_02G025400 [Sorghum bicolor]|uniref:Uncharacterized protein n=2 Tax=Sorghum bicolor TaxID=4558 RepID=A0A921UR72_SORBI|nr:hypothetical protein BDA96_02G025400 [Sorghum bicolor]KXG34341.1 hypothetical protein SORBI_3002G025200 [Sorghum bicolor]
MKPNNLKVNMQPNSSYVLLYVQHMAREAVRIKHAASIRTQRFPQTVGGVAGIMDKNGFIQTDIVDSIFIFIFLFRFKFK